MKTALIGAEDLDLAAFRDLIAANEDIMMEKITEYCDQLPQAEVKQEHIFADGQYLRSSTFPAGMFVIGERHRFATINILLTGSATVYNGKDEPMSHVEAPMVYVSRPGVKKVLLFHEETTWMNPFPADEGEGLDKIHDRMYIRKKGIE